MGKLALAGTVVMSAILSVGVCQAASTPVGAEISDEEVLRLVDPRYPGLERFAASMARGDLPGAHELLARHFATRTEPILPPAEFPGVGEGNSMIVLPARVDRPKADETWMKHVFTLRNNDAGTLETHDMGPAIDWMRNPSEALSWILYLNQLNHLAGLAGLYRDTRDETYVVEIGESVASWTRQCPRGYGYMRDGRPVSSPMEVRNRLCNLIAAYEVVRTSPSLGPPAHMAFWKMFVACSRELVTYRGVSYPGLIPAAVMFPEFAEAETWLAAGEANLRATLVDRTSPEGAWDTHSISYQTVPVPWSARVLEFLRANPGTGDHAGIEDVVVTQMRKMLGLMMWLAMPNGGLPSIGDTYGRTDWGLGQLNGILTSYLASQTSPGERARLGAISDPFDRLKAALAVEGEGHQGEPRRASVGFPGTGYYVMRSGWQAGHARYLYFDLSPQALGHAHSDAGHIDLYAYGKPLLADTGDYFLGWGYRTALHNTIEVDGAQQSRGNKALMMPCEWLTTSGFDFVDGAHGAYEDRGVIHRRKVLFVKPDYFLLCDLLTGEGSHRFEQFFHFAGPTQTEPATAGLNDGDKSVATDHGSTANVHVVPACTDGLRVAFVEAADTDMAIGDKYDRKAMLGWMVTDGTFRRVKSPVAVYTREGEAPQSFHDVLFPTPVDGTADVRVETLVVTQDGAELTPDQAVGVVVRWRLQRPAYPPGTIRTDYGENVALGKPGFAWINRGTIAETGPLLTNGDTGARLIGAAVSSAPYTPNVHLKGHFGVDLAQGTEVNTVVLHHGTWNGNSIIYPPETTTIQHWDGTAWQDVAHARTTRQAEHVTVTAFDTVNTTRLRVCVERAAGGRLSLREFEAYRVTDEERRRIRRLRQEVTVEEGEDIVLISHQGPGLRRYGDFVFDGEVAVLRGDGRGTVRRLSVKTACGLREKGRILLKSEDLLDSLTAEWRGPELHVDCLAPYGIELAAQEARQVFAGREALPATHGGGSLHLGPGVDGEPPRIMGLQVRQRPAQEGMAGAQPSAVITWRTDEPATSQVEFEDRATGIVRRTALDTRFTVEHEATAHFLRPDARHVFRALSSDQRGNRSESTAE